MARINQVILIEGKRGTGKSTYLRELIRKYRLKHPTQKILIISAINQPSYKDIPTIDLTMLPRWKNANIYKIYGSNTEEILQAVEEHFTNGLLIMEDATSFIPKTIPKEVRRMIIDTKQKNVDMLITFHGFMSTPPELLRYCDAITMFRTDSPESRKNEIGAYFEDVLKAYNEINKSTNPYYNKTIKVS